MLLLFFSLLAVLSGADSYPKIAIFIENKFWQFDEIFNMGWVKPPEKSTIRKIFYKVDYEDLEDKDVTFNEDKSRIRRNCLIFLNHAIFLQIQHQ